MMLLLAVALQVPSILAAGQTFELSKRYETSETSSDGSSSSSNGQNVILERVLAVREDGVELEYDLPPNTTAEDRSRQWEFPARIFRPSHGPAKLLNLSEMELRNARWLKAGKLDRSACGRWIFTWNAFQITCDPQAVIGTIDSVDLRSQELKEGALYRDARAVAPVTLTKRNPGSDGATFVALAKRDPAAVRRERAESDVVIGEIMRQPVTLDAALAKRAQENVSGTISVTFEVDIAGNIGKRIKATKLEITRADGVVEHRTATETVERRRASSL